MTRRAIVLLVLCVAACDSDPAVVPPDGSSDAAGPDAAGSDAAGADAVGQEAARRPAIMLDDFEGGGEIPTLWLLSHSPGASLGVMPPSPLRAASLLALNVTPAATGADVFTHHHIDWTERFAGLRFWVRTDAPAPVEVDVAVTAGVSETHGEALAAGRPWLMARLSAKPAWTQVTVPFDTLMPEGPGTPQGTFGDNMGVLHFLVPGAGAGGVWLDDIELLCGDEGCAARP